MELGGGNWGEIGGEYRAPAPLYVADNNLPEKQVSFPLSPVAHAARTRGNGPACSLSLLTLWLCLVCYCYKNYGEGLNKQDVPREEKPVTGGMLAEKDVRTGNGWRGEMGAQASSWC